MSGSRSAQAIPAPTMAELLAAVPVPNARAETEYFGEHQEVARLSAPIRRRWYMKPPLSLVLPFGTHRRLELDALGTEVWKRCNGTRTTEQIVEEFASRHRLTFHEARVSVMQFLKELTLRGFLVVTGAAVKETQQ